MRRSLLLLAPLLLAGCFEFEEQLIEVRWEPDAATFHVERSYRNVPASSLDCASTSTCLEALSDLVSGEGELQSATLDGALGEGAALESIHLEQRGEALDVVVRYSAAQTSPAAAQVHVYVEEEERCLRTREHLLVMPLLADDVLLVEPTRRVRSRVIQLSTEDSAPQPFTMWSLSPRVRELTLLEDGEDGLLPLFRQLPELDEALLEAGLLEAAE